MPCKVEIPWFIEFEQIYKDRGFSVIGVSMDDDGWDMVKLYIHERRINYRILVADASYSAPVAKFPPPPGNLRAVLHPDDRRHRARVFHGPFHPPPRMNTPIH